MACMVVMQVLTTIDIYFEDFCSARILVGCVLVIMYWNTVPSINLGPRLPLTTYRIPPFECFEHFLQKKLLIVWSYWLAFLLLEPSRQSAAAWSTLRVTCKVGSKRDDTCRDFCGSVTFTYLLSPSFQSLLDTNLCTCAIFLVIVVHRNSGRAGLRACWVDFLGNSNAACSGFKIADSCFSTRFLYFFANKMFIFLPLVCIFQARELFLSPFFFV